MTRTVFGPTKRVKAGRARPLSSAKCNARKSAAILALDSAVGKTWVAPNIFIGGRLLSAMRARVGVSEMVGAEQAARASDKNRTAGRIMGDYT